MNAQTENNDNLPMIIKTFESAGESYIAQTKPAVNFMARFYEAGTDVVARVLEFSNFNEQYPEQSVQLVSRIKRYVRDENGAWKTRLKLPGGTMSFCTTNSDLYKLFQELQEVLPEVNSVPELSSKKEFNRGMYQVLRRLEGN